MLNDKVKTLLLNACKTCGANVNHIMSYIEENLTIEEYRDAKAFLTWSFTNKKFFGHGNFKERYAQFKRNSK
jgi:hypothetical protein